VWFGWGGGWARAALGGQRRLALPRIAQMMRGSPHQSLSNSNRSTSSHYRVSGPLLSITHNSNPHRTHKHPQNTQHPTTQLPHRRTANCAWRAKQAGLFGKGQQLVVEATRAIRKGEELTMDFGPGKLDAAVLLDYGVLDAEYTQVLGVGSDVGRLWLFKGRGAIACREGRCGRVRVSRAHPRICSIPPSSTRARNAPQPRPPPPKKPTATPGRLLPLALRS